MEINEVAKMYEETAKLLDKEKYIAAITLMRKLAEQGEVEAQLNLASFYMYGNGVEKNIEESIYWYEKAAEQGDVEAQRILGDLYFWAEEVKQDYEKAVYWLKKAAKQGDAFSQNELAYLYKKGLGVDQSFIKAWILYTASAIQGDVDSQFELGQFYQYGLGTEKDYKKAAYWYQKAVEQKEQMEANIFLGAFYENGLGVEQDYEKACEIYRETGQECYSEKIISKLNGKKVKIINNISEALEEEIDEEKYGAIKIIPKDNVDFLAHTLYSIEDFKKIRREIKTLLKSVENNNGKNELKVFMQIYTLIANIVTYDCEEEVSSDDYDRLYTSRNLVGGVLKGKSVCTGYAEILRNFLACRNIECRIISSQGHTYNQVKINGKWYYADLTNDADSIRSGKRFKWCLKGKDTFKNDNNIGLHNDYPNQTVDEAKEDYPEEEIKKVFIEVMDEFIGEGLVNMSRFLENEDEGLQVDVEDISTFLDER